MTMPKALGGNGQGAATKPEELFAAGYAASFEPAIRLVARRRELEMPCALALSAAAGSSASTTLTVGRPEAQLVPCQSSASR